MSGGIGIATVASSMTPQLNIPQADLHTPEELLDNAEALFAANNPKMMRAAILEAITALEAYVQATVFTALQGKLDPLLVKWLEEKTKLDFDSRLSVLAPVAIEQSVDKSSPLWANYKKAKQIRNKVTHSGAKVDTSDARFVIDTVYEWLAHLGNTVEFGLSLLRLKEYVEQNHIAVPNETSAIAIIRDYFGRTRAAHLAELGIPGSAAVRADIVLTLGRVTTVIETKFSEPRRLKKTTEAVRRQLAAYLKTSSFSQGAAVIFHRGKVAEEFQDVQRFKIIISPGDIRNYYSVTIKV